MELGSSATLPHGITSKRRYGACKARKSYQCHHHTHKHDDEHASTNGGEYGVKRRLRERCSVTQPSPGSIVVGNSSTNSADSVMIRQQSSICDKCIWNCYIGEHGAWCMGGSNDEYFLCASDTGDYVEAVLSVNPTQIHLYEQVRVDKTKPAWSTGQPSGVQVVLGFRRRLRADAQAFFPQSKLNANALPFRPPGVASLEFSHAPHPFWPCDKSRRHVLCTLSIASY